MYQSIINYIYINSIIKVPLPAMTPPNKKRRLRSSSRSFRAPHPVSGTEGAPHLLRRQRPLQTKKTTPPLLVSLLSHNAFCRKLRGSSSPPSLVTRRWLADMVLVVRARHEPGASAASTSRWTPSAAAAHGARPPVPTRGPSPATCRPRQATPLWRRSSSLAVPVPEAARPVSLGEALPGD